MHAVREDVHEQRAARSQPRRDAREESLVVAQVLEHLHGHHAIEALRLGELQRVDVAGDHVDVREPARRGAREDEVALGMRVGNRGDAAARKPLRHRERQRTPAAAELQHVLAVGEPRTPDREVQHRVLGRARDPVTPGSVVAAGVFEARAEHVLEERRGHLVVLCIGRLRVDRERTLPQRGDQCASPLLLRLERAAAFLLEPLREQSADGATDQRIRHQPGVEQSHRERRARETAARPGHEARHAPLIVAIELAPRLQGLFFGRTHAGHLQQQKDHDRRRDERQRSPGRAERDERVAHPDSAFEEVVRMAGETPQPGVADAAGVARIALEARELAVGEALTGQRHRP